MFTKIEKLKPQKREGGIWKVLNILNSELNVSDLSICVIKRYRYLILIANNRIYQTPSNLIRLIWMVSVCRIL